MNANIPHDYGLRPQAVMILLRISQSTYYRWLADDWVPHHASLILRSVALGLPVLMSRSTWWDGHRFAVDGSIRMPNDYPLWPADLWAYYWLNINGEIQRACERSGVTWPPLQVVSG